MCNSTLSLTEECKIAIVLLMNELIVVVLLQTKVVIVFHTRTAHRAIVQKRSVINLKSENGFVLVPLICSGRLNH